MNVWGRLFRRKPQKIIEPEQLLDLLIDAHSAGNGKLLSQLCNEYQDEIANNFDAWRLVPEYLKADEAAVRHYVETLIAVSTTFANDLNLPELRTRLTGDEASLPRLLKDSLLRLSRIRARLWSCRKCFKTRWGFTGC
jgi:hypothetical protein